MPHAVTTFQPTPNPNALKCVLDRPLDGPIRSFRTPADAKDDPLARELFAVPGVTTLLLSGAWLTVNKSPDAPWAPIKAGVEAVLAKVP
jgi:hypothetical protein